MITKRIDPALADRFGSRFLSVLLVVAVLGLAACQVRLVGDYDEQVANGLTSYQRDVTAFLHRMSSAEGDEGNYDRNKEFYHRSKAQLESLITRAKAMDEGLACLPAKYVELGIGALEKKVSDARALVPAVSTGSDSSSASGTSDKDSCTVVVLTKVKDNNEILEQIHKRNGKLAPVVLDIVKPTVEQGVRIALKNELAKKRGGN